MKLHTFVICAYKESPYLEECIKSLLIQESVALGMSDIVLYTATPSDFIDGICDKYSLKKVVGNSKGIGANWNEALSCSETKLATIAHQDDIYEKSYGIKIIESFQKDKRINIAFSDYYEIDGSGQKRKRNLNLKIKTLGLKFLSFIPNRSYQRRIYAFGNFICCPAVSYNLENLKNFKFNEEMKMVVDWDAWERIMKKEGKNKYIPELLMAHRIHAESETTVNTNDKNREIEEFEMYRRYWGKNISKFLMKFYINNQKGNG